MICKQPICSLLVKKRHSNRCVSFTIFTHQKYFWAGRINKPLKLQTKYSGKDGSTPRVKSISRAKWKIKRRIWPSTTWAGFSPERNPQALAFFHAESAATFSMKAFTADISSSLPGISCLEFKTRQTNVKTRFCFAKVNTTESILYPKNLGSWADKRQAFDSRHAPEQRPATGLLTPSSSRTRSFVQRNIHLLGSSHSPLPDSCWRIISTNHLLSRQSQYAPRHICPLQVLKRSVVPAL